MIVRTLVISEVLLNLLGTAKRSQISKALSANVTLRKLSPATKLSFPT